MKNQIAKSLIRVFMMLISSNLMANNIQYRITADNGCDDLWKHNCSINPTSPAAMPPSASAT